MENENEKEGKFNDQAYPVDIVFTEKLLSDTAFLYFPCPSCVGGGATYLVYLACLFLK